VTEAELDEDLVRRFRAGEAQAFTDLVLRHQQRVYSLCLRVLGDADAAADVAQDTFLTVLRKLDGFRGDAAFTTWLHRVTVNACYDELRRKRRRPMLHAVADDDLEHEPGPPTADHADEVAGTHDAASALASIPEEFRIALVLADVQDMAYEQIAQVLEVPIGTVKSRVHRGRLALAAALGIEPAPREPLDRPPTSEQEP
jgi:RNA polymerase sigma-70 factor, ECF subfamily